MLPLDVQHSGLQYGVEILDHCRHAIRLALGELAGSSAAGRQRIAEHQPFTSLQVFRDRVRPKRRTFEALARIGALDAFIDYNRDLRGALLVHIHALTGAVQSVTGTQFAFDLDLPTPDTPTPSRSSCAAAPKPRARRNGTDRHPPPYGTIPRPVPKHRRHPSVETA